ncbi:MAG: hypothetical protein JNL11_16560 [Bdellovibrionaceae bacterium]|nr:hypothetical protein [Pseudobdellovibrionaceae bacterium]
MAQAIANSNFRHDPRLSHVCGCTLWVLTVLFLGQVTFAEQTVFESKSTVLCSSPAKKIVYHFQENDHVGLILHQLGMGPLWGQGHFAQKTLELNQISDDKKIPKGFKLQMPIECQEVILGCPQRLTADSIVLLSTSCLAEKSLAQTPKQENALPVPQTQNPGEESLREKPRSRTSSLHLGGKDNLGSKMISVELGLVYRVLKGKDHSDSSTAKLVSSANPGINIRLGLLPDGYPLQWGFYFGYEHSHFKTSDSTPSLENNPIGLFHVGADVLYSLKKNIALVIELSSQPMLTYAAALGSGLELKQRRVIHSLVGVQYSYVPASWLSGTALVYVGQVLDSEVQNYQLWGTQIVLSRTPRYPFYGSVAYSKENASFQNFSQDAQKLDLALGWRAYF